MHPHFAGDVGQNLVPIFQFNSKHCVGQCFKNFSLHLYQLFLRHVTIDSKYRGPSPLQPPNVQNALTVFCLSLPRSSHPSKPLHQSFPRSPSALSPKPIRLSAACQSLLFQNSEAAVLHEALCRCRGPQNLSPPHILWLRHIPEPPPKYQTTGCPPASFQFQDKGIFHLSREFSRLSWKHLPQERSMHDRRKTRPEK